MKSLLIVVLIILVAGVFWWYSGKTKAPANSANTVNNTAVTTAPVGNGSVVIQGMQFSPKSVTVPKGGTVTWTNKDTFAHTVTADNKTKVNLSSSQLASGQTYSFKFDTPGTYTYHCSIHPNMKGTVTVTE